MEERILLIQPGQTLGSFLVLVIVHKVLQGLRFGGVFVEALLDFLPQVSAFAYNPNGDEGDDKHRCW